MKKLLIISTAAVLLSGSLASADNPFIPNDNDHMDTLSTVIERNAAARSYGALIVTSTSQGGGVAAYAMAARPVSPGFLLHSDENDQKRIDNQYAR